MEMPFHIGCSIGMILKKVIETGTRFCRSRPCDDIWNYVIEWVTMFAAGNAIAHIMIHDYVIKWKHFPRYWPFVRGIHRSTINSPHKGQWRGALMFSLISTWINGWVNTPGACDLRRHRAHYDITEMLSCRGCRLWNTRPFTPLTFWFIT